MFLCVGAYYGNAGAIPPQCALQLSLVAEHRPTNEGLCLFHPVLPTPQNDFLSPLDLCTVHRLED